MKSGHGTRYIFTMEVEDIPCNSQCLFSIEYPDQFEYYYTNETYHFQSPKIGMIGVHNNICGQSTIVSCNLSECRMFHLYEYFDDYAYIYVIVVSWSKQFIRNCTTNCSI